MTGGLLSASRVALCAAACALCGAAAGAQVSLQAAVDLALRNSPRVRGAQADLDKARAALSEARDTYIPTVATSGGYGQFTGAPLNVPVIFNISAQSLVFSFAQRDYIRSARLSVESAEHSLHEQQIEIVEDTTNTYLALDSTVARRRVLDEESAYAHRLVSITTDRITAGVDAQVELPKSRRTSTQISLASLLLDDEIAANRQHLGTLTGLPAGTLRTEPASIPHFDAPLAAPTEQTDADADSEGVAALFSAARARQFSAFGDRRYLFRPQVSFGANYSRVDTGLSSYASYYPRYQGTTTMPNSQNSLGFGLQISVPLLDMAHRAKARESAADAKRAYADAEQQRGLFREGRAKLQHAALELQLRADLARDEQEIARDQLEALEIQLQAGSTNPQGPQLTPKDELLAQLGERQRMYDMLTAELQLRQTQINLLRQTDGLGVWIANPGTTRLSVPPSTPLTNGAGAPGTAPFVAPAPTPAVPSTPLAAPQAPSAAPTPVTPKP